MQNVHLYIMRSAIFVFTQSDNIGFRHKDNTIQNTKITKIKTQKEKRLQRKRQRQDKDKIQDQGSPRQHTTIHDKQDKARQASRTSKTSKASKTIQDKPMQGNTRQTRPSKKRKGVRFRVRVRVRANIPYCPQFSSTILPST
jgi:hypothetical protein